MRIRHLAITLLAAMACLSTAAVARTEYGPVLSLYEVHTSPVIQPGMSRNFTDSNRKHAKASTSRRAATPSYKKKTASSHSHGGGGASRSCLAAPAKALLNRIEAQFGSVTLVSTCRPGAVIATSGKPSKHRNGMAIDFDAGSRKAAVVSWLVANHHSGGTMTYRDMSHIHVDIGYRFVSLGARSGRG